MIGKYEDEMICDLAETYHVFNYRELPVKLLAALVSGLRANSRVKMKMTGAKIPDDITLLAAIYDRLTELAWMQTADGHKNINRPVRLYDRLTKEDEEPEIMAFDSGSEFDRAYAAAIGGR